MAFTFKHGDRPLAGYEIQRGVGRGGFGEVYYAISDGGREVALKYLREHPEVELRGIAQCINLKSPHLVSIFDVKQNDNGEYFVVMEYVSGPSLRDMLIAEPNGLGSQKAAFFVREIAKGLRYLHDRGIVHRDLKPGNIFYDEGYVKICDYGLSKFISVSRHSAQTASIGTVHYMAPEVGSGNYSKTIDIYALGVILYEMLLGRVPYEGSSMGEILMKHLTQQPEVERLPQPFADVIRKALAKDPSDRFEHVDQMVESLFDVEEIKQSVVGFEPTSLTQVAAQVSDDLRPSPVPSDSPLRAGRFGRRRAERGDDSFSRRFVERTAGLDVRLSRKERRRARRKKDGAAKNRTEPPQLLGQDHAEQDVIRSPYFIGFGRRLARLLAATLLAGGLAFAIGLISTDPALGCLSFVIILSGVVGIGLGNKVASWLGPDHPALIGRLLILAFAAPTAGLVYGAISQGGVGREVLGSGRLIYAPLLVTFALFSWRDRIRNGLRGDLGVWDAAWCGLVTWIASQVILQGHASDEAALWLGGVAGAIVLTLQAFAWALVRNPRPAPEIEPRVTEPPPAPAAAEGSREPASEGGFVIAREWPENLSSLDIPRRHVRSKVVRIIAAVLALLTVNGIVALSVALGMGEFRGGEEEMGAIVGITAMSLFFLFWAGKLTRVKRVGVWNEWLNPILRVFIGTALAAGISGLSLLNLSSEECVGLIVLTVATSTIMLLLLIARRTKRRQLQRFYQSRVAYPDGANQRSEPAELQVSS